MKDIDKMSSNELRAEVSELRGIIQVILTAHELKGGEFDGLKAWINEELRAV